MHPFCCVSSAIPEPMTPPPATSSSVSGMAYSNNYNHQSDNKSLDHHQAGRQSRSQNNSANQSPNRNHSINRSLSRSSQPPSRREIAQLTAAHCSSSDAAKINDIVGNGISGILYKWVNYGKGWRPRWFVLQDGVLSYYKIHGPDKILLSRETEKGARVIGEEFHKRISRPVQRTSFSSSQRYRSKPVGEVHLKVFIHLSSYI